MIDFDCPKCGGALSVPESLGGYTESCPQCGQVNRVPKPPSAVNNERMLEFSSQQVHLLKDIRGEIRWITIWIKLSVAVVGVVVGALILLAIFTWTAR